MFFFKLNKLKHGYLKIKILIINFRKFSSRQIFNEKSKKMSHKISNFSIIPDDKFEPCKVCGEPSSGWHCGAVTCEACKVFSKIVLISNYLERITDYVFLLKEIFPQKHKW